MLNKSVFSFVLAVTLILTGWPAAAQTQKAQASPDNVPALLVKANEAYIAKDYMTFRTTLERLHKLRPYNGQYMYQLVIAHALLDEKDQAYNMMLTMQKQGLSYDFSVPESTKNIRGTEVFDYVNDLMIMAGKPLGESEPVVVLPDDVRFPESITWDESRQKFLIGSISDGSIHTLDTGGQVEELLKANNENGLWAVMDILVDQARNRLWVSSAAIPVFSGYNPADKGRSALLEFNLETLELIRTYPVPVDQNPHVLGSMVLGPNGDIYIADRALPIVFKKAAGEEKIKAVLASRDMVSLRGIAMQPDGEIMYLADREMGIMVADFKGRRAMKLGIPETLNLGGIDGIYLWNNHLVIIQNGNSPERVMRLELDETHTKVIAIRPLAVAQIEFDSPGFGTIRGEDLIYFANRQLNNTEGKVKPVTILRTPLDSSKDLAEPDMVEFLKKRSEANEARLKNREQDEVEK